MTLKYISNNSFVCVVFTGGNLEKERKEKKPLILFY
jgi:hypothetical protein